MSRKIILLSYCLSSIFQRGCNIFTRGMTAPFYKTSVIPSLENEKKLDKLVFYYYLTETGLLLYYQVEITSLHLPLRTEQLRV